jgi:transglutaminase-like putative cysteine protease
VLLSAAGAATFELTFLFYATAFMTAAVLFARGALVWQAQDGPWRLTVAAGPRQRRRKAAFAAATLTVMVVSGAASYVLFPRMKPLGFTEPFLAPGAPVTGFSSEVTLGSGVGNILENDALAFRAKISTQGVTGQSPVPLYWRGTALAQWTGDGWRRLPQGARPDTDYIVLPLPLRIQARGRGNRALGRDPVEQEITLERLSTDALFALPGVRQVDSPVASAVRLDIRTAEIAKAPRSAVTGPFVYKVVSYPAFPTPDLAAARGVYSGPDRHMRMAGEKEGIPPSVVDLARRVAGSLPTAYDRALAVQRYLQENYEYSTEITRPASGYSPLESFLFVTRKGHCEFFATAMALMLRAVDVPTRVVNGFLGGEYNPVGDYYAVRQSNAHSWTEVYFAGRGWFTFDATPEGVGGLTPQRPGWLRPIVDYLRYKWLGSVAGYSRDSQAGVYRALAVPIRPVMRPVEAGYRLIRRAAHLARPERSSEAKGLVSVMLLSMFVFAAAFFAAAAAGWIRLFARSVRRRVVRRRYPDYYAAFLRALARRGFVRRADETPLELAARAARSGAVARGPAETIVRAWYRERFAGEPLAPAEAQDIARLVRGALRARP